MIPGLETPGADWAAVVAALLFALLCAAIFGGKEK